MSSTARTGTTRTGTARPRRGSNRRRVLEPGAGGVAGTLLGLTVAAFMALPACDPYDHMDLCVIAAQGSPSLTVDQMLVPQGRVAIVKFVPMRDDGDPYDDETHVSVQTDNPGVLRVLPVSRDVEKRSGCEGPDDVGWTYALTGVSQGSTTLRVLLDGREVETIPVQVPSPRP